MGEAPSGASADTLGGMESRVERAAWYGILGVSALGWICAIWLAMTWLLPTLSAAGLVTRDAREVERKKVGLHKARRRKQYSKR